MIFVTGAGCAYFATNNMLISFFIGIYCYHQAYAKHIQTILDQMMANQLKSVARTRTLLIEIIKFHNASKDIFHQSANAFSSYVLILLIFSMIVLACTAFQLDMVIILLINVQSN